VKLADYFRGKISFDVLIFYPLFNNFLLNWIFSFSSLYYFPGSKPKVIYQNIVSFATA